MSLHTSFLRVIMHHEPLKPALQPAATEVNRTTDYYTVASVDSHASPEATTVTVATGRLIDLIHHQNRSSHKALETLPMATTRPSHTQVNTQVNLPFSYHYYHRSKGTSLPPEMRYRTPLFDRKHVQTGRSTSCASFPHLLLQLHRRNRKDRRQAYSLLQTTMEPLPHGL